MKSLLAIVLGIVLAGCAATTPPTTTYRTTWCNLDEIRAADGVTLYVYSSPQGNIVIARDAQGHMCGVASGRQIDTAIAECLKAMK